MKNLLLSDLHHGKGDSYMETYQLSFLESIPKLIEAKNIKRIIFLGDILDKRRTADLKILQKFKSAYDKIISCVDHVVVVCGNHDSYYTTTNSTNSLKRVIDHEKVVYVEENPIIVDNMIITPWINQENKEDVINLISQHNQPENVLLGHFELDGFKLSSKFTSDKTQLYVSDYNKYKHVFSGHFHIMQKKDNIIYIGSPYELTFGERGDHGIYIFDNDTFETEYISNKKSLFASEIVLDGLDEETIKSQLSTLKNKYAKVFINSSETNYINKVEKILIDIPTLSLNVQTKDSDVDMLDNSEQKNETIEETIDNYLNEMTFFENVKKNKLVKELFKKYWDRCNGD